MLGLTLPNNNLQSLTKRVGTAPQSCVQLVYCMEIIISQTVSPLPPFQRCSHYDNKATMCSTMKHPDEDTRPECRNVGS